MTVYVDDAKNKHRPNYVMSHMIATSEYELHKFAERLGLKREWFQEGRHPHYDICQSKRKLAIQLGAVPVNSKELVWISRSVNGMSVMEQFVEGLKR